MKRMSAPAFRNSSPRRSASSSPRVVRASVRAMIRKSFDDRACAATLIRRTHPRSAPPGAPACGRISSGTLILELDRRSAGGLIAAHCEIDIEEPAITGVTVGNERGGDTRRCWRTRPTISV